MTEMMAEKAVQTAKRIVMKATASGRDMDGYINRPSDTKLELCNTWIYLCKCFVNLIPELYLCKCLINLKSELLIIQHDFALELHPMRRGM